MNYKEPLMMWHLNYRDVKTREIQNLDLGRHHHDSQCTRSHCKMHPTEPAVEYGTNDDALLPLGDSASERTGRGRAPSHAPSSPNVSEPLAPSPELTVSGLAEQNTVYVLTGGCASWVNGENVEMWNFNANVKRARGEFHTAAWVQP